MEAAATTTATSTQISFNPKHLANPVGVFRVLEIVFGLLCWALVAEFTPYEAAYQFVIFATVTPWIVSLFLLFLYLFSVTATTLSNWPWTIIEFTFNGFWGVIYFTAACVLAAFTRRSDQLIAATVFGFFTAVIYLFHGVTAFMDWRGTPFGSSKSAGMEVSA